MTHITHFCCMYFRYPLKPRGDSPVVVPHHLAYSALSESLEVLPSDTEETKIRACMARWAAVLVSDLSGSSGDVGKESVMAIARIIDNKIDALQMERAAPGFYEEMLNAGEKVMSVQLKGTESERQQQVAQVAGPVEAGGETEPDLWDGCEEGDSEESDSEGDASKRQRVE